MSNALRISLRTAATAFVRVFLFAVLYVVLHETLATLLLRWSSAQAFLLDSIARLAAAVIAGLLLLRVFEHGGLTQLGLPLNRKVAPQISLGLLVGTAALIVAGVALLAVGALRYRADAGSLAKWLGGMISVLFALLIPAASEEALFRGYPFQKLVAGVGPWIATAAASVVFAAAHAQNPGVTTLALCNIAAAGAMLSLAYLRTRSLWFATGVHLGWNWSMVALLDLPVSGLRLYDAPLYEAVERGPEWLSGGSFGPEAGLVGLLGVVAASALIMWLTRKTGWLT